MAAKKFRIGMRNFFRAKWFSASTDRIFRTLHSALRPTHFPLRNMLFRTPHSTLRTTHFALRTTHYAFMWTRLQSISRYNTGHLVYRVCGDDNRPRRVNGYRCHLTSTICNPSITGKVYILTFWRLRWNQYRCAFHENQCCHVLVFLPNKRRCLLNFDIWEFIGFSNL